jgi:hypothetical protein
MDASNYFTQQLLESPPSTPESLPYTSADYDILSEDEEMQSEWQKTTEILEFLHSLPIPLAEPTLLIDSILEEESSCGTGSESEEIESEEMASTIEDEIRYLTKSEEEEVHEMDDLYYSEAETSLDYFMPAVNEETVFTRNYYPPLFQTPEDS